MLRATYRLDAGDAADLVVWPTVERLESDCRRRCDVGAELGEERLGASAVSTEYALQTLRPLTFRSALPGYWRLKPLTAGRFVDCVALVVGMW